MKTITLYIENIKCHGCANTIAKELQKIEGVEQIEVLVEKNAVTIGFNGITEVIDNCRKRLKKLGYPEAGKNSAMNKAKSYVSCAIGRISDTPE